MAVLTINGTRHDAAVDPETPLFWVLRDTLGLTGAKITTIEGLAAGGKLHKVQQARLALDVPQCGYRQSGMPMAAAALLAAKPQPTGYPLYRSEWQAVGPLERRFRNCMTGEPIADGAPEHAAIETFLMCPAAGMQRETPAVRR
jgi:aerobic-type carbon monoxide dehydrogenase small subunit (CoxS/CutS family)